MKQLTNPYWAMLLFPLLSFVLLMGAKVEPDIINLWLRLYTFGMLCYVGARYVGRAPMLMWERNTSPEARNVVGWAIVIVGFALNIAYGWVYIAYDRPIWLSSQYWGVSFVVWIALGVTIVASSVPKFPPFRDGKNGLSDVASFFVVLISALSVFAISHIPQIWTAIKGLWLGIASRAF